MDDLILFVIRLLFTETKNASALGDSSDVSHSSPTSDDGGEGAANVALACAGIVVLALVAPAACVCCKRCKGSIKQEERSSSDQTGDKGLMVRFNRAPGNAPRHAPAL